MINANRFVLQQAFFLSRRSFSKWLFFVITSAILMLPGLAAADEANFKSQLLAEARNAFCHVSVFKNSSADLLVLQYEWLKIKKSAANLYVQNFPRQKKPQGDFVVGTDREIGKKVQAFYSPNKHFEKLVAEALIGRGRTHFEFKRGVNSAEFKPPLLSPEFHLKNNNGADYANLGKAVADEFEKQMDSRPSVNPSSEYCLVYSQWEELQTIDGVEYEQRFVHYINDTSPKIFVTPRRRYKGEFSRMHFSTFAVVRCKQDRLNLQSNSENFLLECTLVSRDNDTDLTSDPISYYLEKVNNDNLKDVSDEFYAEKLAFSLLSCSAVPRADELQKAIAKKVTGQTWTEWHP